MVMAVYGQPLMLAKQLEVIGTYSDEVLAELTVVIVDDHGTPPVAKGFAEDLSDLCATKLYRVDDDIPWNQMGARNLGMHESEGWCLMIDPDMTFSNEMMVKLMAVARKEKRGTVTRYNLKHMSGPQAGVIDTSSPNTYLIHREDFFAVGGYDEEYRGNKGWSDVQLLDILKNHYSIRHKIDLYADFWGTDLIADAAVTSLDRSTGVNKRLRVHKANLAKRGGWKQWVKKHNGPNLRFKWTRVH